METDAVLRPFAASDSTMMSVELTVLSMRLERERDQYRAMWERDSKALGEALGQRNTARAVAEDNRARYVTAEAERDEAGKALRKASVALDDWLNTYAAEFCDDGRVKEAYDRINENGGTIAYIADLQQEIRAILAKVKG